MVTALVMPYATTCPTGAVRFGAINERQNWGGYGACWRCYYPRECPHSYDLQRSYLGALEMI
jgi:hypothetical protein